MDETRQLKIISDGTSTGTHVEVDGKMLYGVQEVNIRILPNSFAEATIVVHAPHVELDGKANLEFEAPPKEDAYVDVTDFGGSMEKIWTHDHVPVQHRDGKPPWCPKCGLDANGNEPESVFEKHKKRNADIDAADEDD